MRTGLIRSFALIAVLLVIASALYIALQPDTPATIGINPVEDSRVFVSPSLDMRFSYPDSYALSEHDATSSSGAPFHVVVLVDKAAAANIPENGEGPASITIEAFAAHPHASLETWIRTQQESNFKLSGDQVLSTTTLAGLPALGYTWDGLYRGESVAVESRGTIYVASVTYADAADPIRADFGKILSDLKF